MATKAITVPLSPLGPRDDAGTDFGSSTSKVTLIGGLDPPNDPEAQWWWRRCAPLLATLLHNSGSYTTEQMADHMRVFRDLVVPSFGPRPQNAKVQPMLTMDGSPFEPSWNFQKGGSIVRYTFEPLWDDAGTGENEFPGARLSAMMPAIRAVASSDLDLRWFDQVWSQWFVSGAELDKAKQTLARVGKAGARIPQVFLAFDMKADQRVLKAYLFPVLKSLATGVPTAKLTFDLIRQLRPGGERFEPAVRRLERYLGATDGARPAPHVEMIALDCIDPSRSPRVKVYARSPADGGNSLAAVRDAMTLGGIQTDAVTMAGVAHVEKFWHLILDERAGLADDQAKEARDPKAHHVGVCFVFEMRQGEEHIDVKAHLPWCQTNSTDLNATQNFAESMRILGWADHAARYEKGTQEAARLPGANYATQAGGLSYMAYNHNKGGDYISSYFSPMPMDAGHGP